ncbi:hypothetical protein DYU05_15735 [Mucilaginibacter terrenus]|uniref:Outer membrane protein beta-barrel domain-containing protein n=1 Tax=Mucilaginibacter terrenus TaxID=2482727 RepID=A0A3E2NMF9_9SPHI|nr:hypothetical protein [Mucilaginibacter terrenus]RFZ82080.1 hypothetical protein DYU05_15735 [Mucilaginibacter terrenus]
MKYCLPLILIFFSVTAFGQKVTSNAFGIGLDLGFPTNSIYNIGFGGSGKAEVPISQSISLTVTAGYTSFYYKSALIGSTRSQDPSGYIPLKAGAKYYLSEGFYLEGEAGTAIETNYNKDKLFAFSVGPGFLFSTGKHTGFDVGLKYENWGSGRLKQTALRVAYRLAW